MIVLDRVGLVRSEPAGREKRYHVDEAQLARAVAQLNSVGATWDARLRRIKSLAAWWTTDTSGDGEWTIVLFAHAGWREPVEFMNHCSTKWAIFLMSLKSLVETGTGTPHPHDVQLSNWH